MIAACTDTSSADVISSHTSSFGSAASARAIATRWRSPPESSSGNAVRRARRQRDALEALGHARPTSPRPPAALEQLELAGDRLADRAPRVQRRVRVLEHVLDLLRAWFERLRAAGGQHVVAERAPRRCSPCAARRRSARAWSCRSPTRRRARGTRGGGPRGRCRTACARDAVVRVEALRWRARRSRRSGARRPGPRPRAGSRAATSSMW